MKRANPTTYIPYPLARRRFLALVSGGLLAAPFAVEAQQARKVPRIGYLGGGASSLFHESFRQELRELGYVEGRILSSSIAGTKGESIARETWRRSLLVKRSMSSWPLGHRVRLPRRTWQASSR